jgi:hypothetical protein
VADLPPLLLPGTTVPVEPVSKRHDAHLRSRGAIEAPPIVDPIPEAVTAPDTEAPASHPVDLTRTARPQWPDAPPQPTED